MLCNTQRYIHYIVKYLYVISYFSVSEGMFGLVDQHFSLPYFHIVQDGFGWTPGTNGNPHQKKPQNDRVIIHDDVEIGANTCIDRGSWRQTIIGEGSKLDNQVVFFLLIVQIQIGHNVQIGKNCLIAAQCGIAGSTTIGNYVFIGGKDLFLFEFIFNLFHEILFQNFMK